MNKKFRIIGIWRNNKEDFYFKYEGLFHYRKSTSLGYNIYNKLLVDRKLEYESKHNKIKIEKYNE